MARALGVPEIEMFKEAGFLSEETPRVVDILEDHELKLFLLNDWKQLSYDEKDWFKRFIGLIREHHKETTSS